MCAARVCDCCELKKVTAGSSIKRLTSEEATVAQAATVEDGFIDVKSVIWKKVLS